MKDLFFRYWFEKIKLFQELVFPVGGLENAMAALAEGEVRPLLEFVAEALRNAAGQHAPAHLDETAIQLAVAMAMNTNAVYRVVAKKAPGAGYADLILRPGKRHLEVASWVIEFKYLKKSDATKSAVEAKLSEATEQLERYLKAENIAAIPNRRFAAAVFSGTELKALKVF